MRNARRHRSNQKTIPIEEKQEGDKEMTIFVFEIDITPRSMLGEVPIEQDAEMAKIVLSRRIVMGTLNEYEHIKIVSVKKKWTRK
jgi:hypothetical protein